MLSLRSWGAEAEEGLQEESAEGPVLELRSIGVRPSWSGPPPKCSQHTDHPTSSLSTAHRDSHLFTVPWMYRISATCSLFLKLTAPIANPSLTQHLPHVQLLFSDFPHSSPAAGMPLRFVLPSVKSLDWFRLLQKAFPDYLNPYR